METAHLNPGARRRRTTVAATVIAALVGVLVGLIAGSVAVPASHPAPAKGTGLVIDALANTAIDLNRSQSSGTYVNEYVTLNNSTTLTKLPAALTVVAGTCKWVTVANLTEAASPASAFHNVQFTNRTTGNATGTISGGGATAFKVCGGTGVWLNYIDWSYSIYGFTTATLGVAGTLKATFSDYPGTTTGPAAVTATLDSSSAVSLTVSSNLTFTVYLPSPVNGSHSCDYTKQVCSYTRYTFASATDGTNTSLVSTIAFTKASGLLVTNHYENWTVGYSSATIQDNTAIGGFFAGTTSEFQDVFVNFWYAWLFVAVFVGVLIAVRRKKGRR